MKLRVSLHVVAEGGVQYEAAAEMEVSKDSMAVLYAADLFLACRAQIEALAAPPIIAVRPPRGASPAGKETISQGAWDDGIWAAREVTLGQPTPDQEAADSVKTP